MQTQRLILLTVLSILITLVGVDLFSQGMFMDGTIYASVSRNLAIDTSSIWDLRFADTIYPQFYEHPPLVFWLQGTFFELFGDSIYIERVYSLLVFIVTIFIILKVWKELTKTYDFGWMPVLLWGSIESVRWSVANNMLENTLSMFLILAFLFILKGLRNKSAFLQAIAGFLIFLGFMSKGVVALYLWGVPFFYWLILDRKQINRQVLNTMILVSSSIIPFILMYSTSANAHDFFDHYFKKQLVGSIKNIETVSTRFAIVGMFLTQVIIPFIITLLFYFTLKNKQKTTKKMSLNTAMLLFTLAVALSGVLPIMVSLKQRMFYIISVYPILAIGLSFWIYPLLKNSQSYWQLNQKGKKYFTSISIVAFIFSVFFMISRVAVLSRDVNTVEDCKLIVDKVGYGETINICKELKTDWGAQAYFMRYGKVSLEMNQALKHEYILFDKSCTESIDENWKPIQLTTQRFQLFQREGF